MAISGTAIEALIAAFAFGIVVNAASAALFLYTRGSGSAIFRDGQRLVLVTFLLSAALWAQVDFITTVIDPKATTSCQIGIIFTTFFDQLARFAIEQYLLWAINTGGKSGSKQMIPQVLVGIRFVLGMVYVGLSRPNFDVVCVQRSQVLPLAIVVVALDAVIIFAAIWLAFSAGLVRQVRGHEEGAPRSKSVLLVIFGVVVWMATSVAMQLGVESMELLLRTTVPAAGLLVLLFIVTACNGALATTLARPPRPPESPGARHINTGHSHTTSSSSEYPPSRYEDLKRAEVTSIMAFTQPRDAPAPRFDQPREAPRFEQLNASTGSLPSISVPIAGANGLGVGGLPIQGQLFPPPRAQIEPANDEPRRVDTRPQPKQKKSLFDLKGGPAAKVSVAKLVISKPILEENGDQNPLNKIPTIDLEVAARNERERRANDLHRASALIAQRPAPVPPRSSAEDMQRMVSLKRKEVVGSGSPQSLEPMPTAATSATQLSPGVEEIRRRSPREPTARQKAPPRPQRSPPYDAVLMANAMPPSDLGGPRYVPIRPSRKLPSSPGTPPAPPAPRTALEMRPTNGLPGNPRAMGLNAGMDTAQQQRQQTVMFVNNIVYNDPQMVEDIMSEANAKQPAVEAEEESSPKLLMHRPRPIPRKPEKDRALFSTIPSPSVYSHRRSRSGGSLISRKSILQAGAAGSPTQLPPLPPPPMSASLQRPLPNDTKSMTFDEKMTLLFPAPPSGNSGAPRMSPIPQLPPLPAGFDGMESPIGGFMGFERGDRTSKSTNRTNRTSVKTENIFEVDELPQTLADDLRRETQDRSIADEVGESWLPGIPVEAEVPMRPSMTDSAARRASSPLIPPTRDSTVTATTEMRTHGDAATDWGSVQSSAAAVNVQGIRQLPQTTYIRPERPPLPKKPVDRETITFMLDSAPQPPSKLDASRTSFLHDDTSPQPNRRVPQKKFHRQIGDECPTFSGRKDSVRGRKMPPPAPLLLGPPSTKNPIIVKAAIPSPQTPPEQALAFIKSQLKKFEQPNPTVESPSQRLQLLDNLEAEMDAQAGHWQEMQHDLSRDSISTFKTSPDVESRRGSIASTANNLSRNPSIKSIAADRRAARRNRMRSNSTMKSVEDAVTSTRSSAESSNASMWQMRLAEAQTDYVDNTSQLRRKRNMNFVNVAQLASPTPPDSDESEFEQEAMPTRRPQHLDIAAAQAAQKMNRKSLWTPGTEGVTPLTSMLWTPAAKMPKKTTDAELPGVTVRPVSRIAAGPLDVASGQLWHEPKTTESVTASGLWEPAYLRSKPSATPSMSAPESQAQAEPEQAQLDNRQSQTQPSQSQKVAPRPNPPRPPRRSKRVTLLPDILESPEPLPDKRGTLGIFQFPWGERSDTATVHQPRGTMFMAMPGTMSSGGQTVAAALAARAKQVEQSEYSSSFFDDYDDDDEVEDSSDEDGSDGDDGFDETTLWEIASLLKTELVPSRNSLLGERPQPRPAGEEYISEMPSDDEDDDTTREEIVVRIDRSESRQAAPAASAAAAPQLDFASLWDSKKEAKAEAERSPGVGLPQPDARTWSQYGENTETARAKPRRSEPEAIESNNLWGAAAPQKEKSAKWTAKQGSSRRNMSVMDGQMEEQAGAPQLKRSNSKDKKSKKAVKTILWVPPPTPASPEKKANQTLFKVEPKQPDNRSTAEAPAAVNMTRKSRSPERTPLPELTSTNLWASTEKAASAKPDWMTGLKPANDVARAKVDPFEALRAIKSLEPVTVREAYQYPDLMSILDEDEASEAAKPDENANANQSSWWQKMKTSFGVAEVAAKSKPTPLRQQHRSNMAIHGSWDVELREALALSYPNIPRPIATTAMWETALKEALARSKPYDPNKTHPVFQASSLVTKSDQFHPAATGYTFDVAHVHPVFFGSVALTCDPEVAHPAWSDVDARRPRRHGSHRDRSRAGGLNRDRSLGRTDSTRRRMARADREAEASPAPTPAPVPTAVVAATSARTAGDEDALLAKRDLILAQIEALEREKEFAEQAVRQQQQQPLRSLRPAGANKGFAASHEAKGKQLWSKPADIDTAASAASSRPGTADGNKTPMWTPNGAKTPKSGKPAIIKKADSEADASARRKARKEKAAAAKDRGEGGGKSGRRTQRSADDGDIMEQPLWSRFEGEQMRRSKSTRDRGQGKDWLDESSQRKTSRVMLRY